ncbi:hypothetical protein O6H91_03G126100 [Diphasiastrum complanatum]|uniref:Uncharacterized protein n=1 Tax=Diphasiastrum complanatum TaxID=34168 RepID=A0ACC2EBV3_DIPCM|nr:hypothetical protein O6H91_03G126100 [Diphasiastrum complanatum]
MTSLKIPSSSNAKPITKPSQNSTSNIAPHQSQPLSLKIEVNSSSSHVSQSAAANSAVNVANNCGSQSVGGANVPNLSTDKPAAMPQRLLHNPGLASDWSAEEQNILDDGLVEFENEINLWKYIKIAARLPEKTVRDVAMRCRWMTKKELGKRRKVEEQHLVKKVKDKEKSLDPVSKPVGAAGTKSAMPMYISPSLSMESDDGISNDVIGGRAGELFEQNVQIISQIRANLAACKPQENTDLLVRFRDNIFTILNGMTNVPGIMSQMPPLPVTLNTELADSVLQKTLHHTSSLQS